MNPEDYEKPEENGVDVQKYFDKVIKGVSHKWDDLARKLGFNENEIKGIETLKPDQDHRCREMLNRWRNREGRGATLQALQQALIDIGERLTAESLEELRETNGAGQKRNNEDQNPTPAKTSKKPRTQSGSDDKVEGQPVEGHEEPDASTASADQSTDETNNKYYTFVERSEKIFHDEVLQDPDKFSLAVEAFSIHADVVLGTDDSGADDSDIEKLSSRAKLTVRRKAKAEIARVDGKLFADRILSDLTTYNRLARSFKIFKATLRKTTRGCVLCYLDFEDDSCYKTFLRAYRDGRLSDTLSRELITDDMRAAEGEDLYVHVTLLGEDGGCQDDSLSDEDDTRGPTERNQVESSTSSFPDVFIKQEPLSPVKVEPTQDLPSCSYATEAGDTKPTLEAKPQQPLGLKTELINRRPPFDYQKVRLRVKAEPHFHVKREGHQPSHVALRRQHRVTGMGLNVKTEADDQRGEHHFIKTEPHPSVTAEQHPRHQMKIEHHRPRHITDTEHHMDTEKHMETEQHISTEHHMDTEHHHGYTEHHTDTEQHMDTEHYIGAEPHPYMDPPSTKETETVAGFGVQQEQTELMYQAQQQEEPFCSHCCNQLMLLADRLGPYWTWLAFQLGFTSTDVERISSTYHPRYHPHWCLWEWVQRELWGASMDAVLVGLRAAGLHQIADAVETGELFQKDVDDGSWGSEGKGQGDKGDGSSSDGDSDDDGDSGGAARKAKPRPGTTYASQISTANLPTYPTGDDALAWNDCLQDFFKTDEDTARSIQESWPTDSGQPQSAFQFVHESIRQSLMAFWVAHILRTQADCTDLLRVCAEKSDHLPITCCSLAHLLSRADSPPTHLQQFVRLLMQRQEVSSNDMEQVMAVLSCLHNLHIKQAELTEYRSGGRLSARFATFTLQCKTRPNVWPGVFSFLPSDVKELVLQECLFKLDLKCLKARPSEWLTLFQGLSSLPATTSFVDGDETSRFPPLKMLGFSDCNLTSENILSLMKKLPTLPNLEEIDLSSNVISDEAVPGLAEGLGSCQNLKKVNLSYNKLSDRGDFLPPLPNLEEIDLSHNAISDEAVPGLAEGLGSCQNLKKGNLSYNKLSDRGDFLPPLPNLEEIDLSFNNISDEAFLPQLPNLQELALHVSCQGEEEAENINQLYGLRHLLKKLKLRDWSLDNMIKLSTQMFQHFHMLEDIDLSWNNISDEAVPGFAEGLASCQNLKKVNLRHNKLSNKGDFLPPLPNLEEIDLGFNNIGDEAVSGLAEGLGSCQSLKKVDLSHNKLSDRGDFLPPLPNLEEINLSHNDISDEAVPGLAESLGSCQNLKKVDLSHNKLSDRGDFLPPLSNLEEIDLSHNDISNEAVSGLAKGLGSCQNLKKVDLSYNKLSDVGDLIEGLIKLPNLTRLDIDNNSIRDEFLPAIAAWLKVSTAVEIVWLYDNRFSADGVRDFVRTMKGKAYRELSNDLLYDGSQADVSEAVESGGEGARREEQQWERLRGTYLIKVNVRQLTVGISHYGPRSNNTQLASP
ncbi:positive regulation of MHC class I biosynthetic process [Branchiostoma belcheri]|nr:positive regulation of MHC class I biosynthetic process [Branchiostoma belcheri]